MLAKLTAVSYDVDNRLSFAKSSHRHSNLNTVRIYIQEEEYKNLNTQSDVFLANLARIREKFPEKEVLNRKDVVDYTGHSYKTVKKLYPFRENFISVITFAYILSGEADSK